MYWKIKQLMKEKRLYILFVMMWFIVQCFCVAVRDDSTFADRIMKEGLLNYYISDVKLGGWSSRFIIDFVLFVFLRYIPMWGWRIMNTVILGLLLYSVTTIFNTSRDDKKIYIWFAIISICFYNYPAQSTAGWMATTITYLWAAVFAVYTISVAWRIVNDIDVSPLVLVLGILAGIYSVDNELCCVFMIVSCGLLCICTSCFSSKRKHSYYIVLLEVIFCLRLMVHLYWQAMGGRSDLEMYYFPDFASLGLIDKIQIGFTTTCYQLFHDIPFPLFVLTLLLCICTFEQYEDWHHRWISIIPFVVVCVEGVFHSTVSEYFPYIIMNRSFDPSRGLINRSNYWLPDGYVALFIWLVALWCIISTLVSLSGTIQETFLYIGLLLSGFLSRMAMGFSPTVAASSTRTTTYLYIGIVICITGFLIKLYEQGKQKRSFVFIFLTVLAILSYLNTLLYAYRFGR